ncbi:MAG: type II secretion system protein, partial [Leptonema sp. (in: Bacteria)]|nr:type II secretion system protein [Leptonema sp. (in: bacteria)]
MKIKTERVAPKIQIKIGLFVNRFFKNLKHRSGMTLVEMGFAISIAAVWSIMTLGTVAAGIDLRRRAEKMSLAASLAQSKLSQLLSQPFLTPTDSKGQMEESGPYANFEFSI